MPPRKNSRVTSVVFPEKIKPTAFKTLCLPDTGFMVDFLGFFSRDDFEKYLQLTCKRMNQLIRTHFDSKPYRNLDNVTLKFNLERPITMSLTKQTTDVSTICWDQIEIRWKDSSECYARFRTMVPFLGKAVRVPKVHLWMSRKTYLTKESIADLESLSHIGENAQVEIRAHLSYGSYLKEHLTTCATLLTSTKLFSCRRFKCSHACNMLPLWDYPEIYSMEVVEVNIQMNYNLTSNLTQLVENQARYPHSQTTFVFSGNRYRPLHNIYVSNVKTDILQKIGNELMESDKAQSFRIIFAIYVGSELPDGEMDEIRLENNRTREVLHLQCVTQSDLAKYCEFDTKTKYFVLERSQ